MLQPVGESHYIGFIQYNNPVEARHLNIPKLQIDYGLILNNNRIDLQNEHLAQPTPQEAQDHKSRHIINNIFDLVNQFL